MRYNRMVSGVLAVAILTAMVGTVVSTTTVPSASATVDPTLCSGNSARISVFPFLLKSCADSDEVWIQSQIHAPITYSYSGDLSSPVIQPSTDDSTNAFRTLINPPTSLLPSEGLTLSAGPGAGSVTLTPPSQSLIFEWAFAKAIAPLVPDPAEQLIIDGAGVIQRATTCISAGGSKTRCYVSALATSLSSIHNDLKDFMDLAGKTLLAVQKYIVQVFTGQFAFQSYLDTVKADDKLNFDNDTLTINPLLQITTDSLPSGTQGTLYDQILQPTGGATGDTPTTYTWKVTSGSLPLGLSLDRSTGEITGTPTSAGTSTFQVTVKDDTDKQTATADLTIDVSGGIVQSAPGSGTTSSASSTSFTDQLNTTGQVGPVTFVTMTSVPESPYRHQVQYQSLRSSVWAATPSAAPTRTTRVALVFGRTHSKSPRIHSVRRRRNSYPVGNVHRFLLRNLVRELHPGWRRQHHFGDTDNQRNRGRLHLGESCRRDLS